MQIIVIASFLYSSLVDELQPFSLMAVFWRLQNRYQPFFNRNRFPVYPNEKDSPGRNSGTQKYFVAFEKKAHWLISKLLYKDTEDRHQKICQRRGKASYILCSVDWAGFV